MYDGGNWLYVRGLGCIIEDWSCVSEDRRCISETWSCVRYELCGGRKVVLDWGYAREHWVPEYANTNVWGRGLGLCEGGLGYMIGHCGCISDCGGFA